jgi:light-regulated signal transduction histidine kinase (bacteriophytochrome)/CheY-like chemotaxis protein
MDQLNFITGRDIKQSTCSQEDISFPALSQPHGMILAVASGGIISHASENFKIPPNLPVSTVIGESLASVIGEGLANIALAAPEVATMNLQEVSFVGALPGGTDGATVMMSAHNYDGRTIIEFEQAEAQSESVPPLLWMYKLQRDMLEGIESSQIGQYLATAIQKVTNYDRVTVYQFESDWHGHIVGEAKVSNLETCYLRLHFPASDIPVQARALYLRQLLRIIVDTHAINVPVLHGASDDPSLPGARPLDMSFAVLRSVSPMHLEYLRNLGVRASIVSSILVQNQLWGLLVGHHHQGRRVPSLLDRKAFQLGAMLGGSALATLAMATTLRLTHAINRVMDQITQNLAGMRLVDALIAEFPALAEALALDGIAVEIAGERRTAGAAMPPSALWNGSEAVLLTERFPVPLLQDASSLIVGGALLRVNTEQSDLVMLGRVEHPRDIMWGGEAAQSDQGEAPRPRAGIERRKEIVRGRCLAFSPAETAAIDVLHQRLGVLARAETERLRAERASQTERLTAMGRVAGGVAHDLNNLLGVISLNLDIARQPLSAAENESSLQAAMQAVESGSAVTSALLSFARKQQMHPADIDTTILLPEFIAMVDTLLGRGIALKLDANAEVGQCRADPAQLRTALLNLVVNARDSMQGREGIITLSTRNRRTATPINGFGHTLPSGDYVAFSVIDHGHGMAEDVLHKATEPFFTTKSDGEGTGLGLPMVFGFAVQSGGSLIIDSSPGCGTTATILLPRAGPRAQPAPQPSRATTASALAGTRLLVVEDRPDLSAVITTLCKRAGMVVTLADTAGAAAELLTNDRFDLVLSDLMLGSQGSGLDVSAAASSLTPPVPVLLMTGFVEANGPQGEELAKHRVLRKPFQLKALLAALEATALSSAP